MRKLLITVPVISILLMTVGFTQDRLYLPRGCQFDGHSFEEVPLYQFPNTTEAEEAVASIMRVSLLQSNFVIIASNVDNAEAIVKDGERYILYSRYFMCQANQRGNWVAIVILAHEIGHHVNGHTLAEEGSRPKTELQADYFAGGTLRRMGATLDEALQAYRDLPSNPQGGTHPPRSARIEAVTSGWEDAGPAVPQNPVVRDDPAPTQPDDFRDYTDPLAGEMVSIAGGSFLMGSNEGESDEKPVHRVSVSDFHIGKYEVTQAQWESVMGDNPSRFSSCAQCPVERVSWEDIQEFLRRLNDRTGKSYRLPTEAEWEYAAGGGSSNRTKYAGTNSESSLGTYAWYSSNADSRTHAVGEKRPNRLGLYDMSGNVWEWCADWFGSSYYDNSPSRDPQGPTSGDYRVIRGGGWGHGPTGCRVAFRGNSTPSDRGNSLGFRLAR